MGLPWEGREGLGRKEKERERNRRISGSRRKKEMQGEDQITKN